MIWKLITIGKVLKLKTLIDSGNLLKEPISNEDVIIVERASLEEIIDKEILDIASEIVRRKFDRRNE